MIILQSKIEAHNNRFTVVSMSEYNEQFSGVLWKYDYSNAVFSNELHWPWEKIIG